MAKDEESKQDASPEPRVYKARDVHKRRFDRKERAEMSRQRPSPEPVEQEPKRDAMRTRFTDMTGLPEDAAVQEQRPNAREGLSSLPNPMVSENADKGDAPTKTSRIAALRSKLPVPTKAGAEKSAESAADEPSAEEKTDEQSASGSETGAKRVPSLVDGFSTGGPKSSAASGQQKDAVDEKGSDTGVDDKDDSCDDGGEAIADKASESKSDASEGDASEGDGRPRSRRRSVAAIGSQWRSRLRIAIIVIIAILVIVGAVAGFYTWNRWYRYDDKADIQGVWYVAGTATSVTIDATTIYLTEDVAYNYEINTQDKTIRFAFGPYEGGGPYWFSDDRKRLVITDDPSYADPEAASKGSDHLFESSGPYAPGGGQVQGGEGTIAFNREPDVLAEMTKLIADKIAPVVAERKAEEDDVQEERTVGAGYDSFYIMETEKSDSSASASDSAASPTTATGNAATAGGTASATGQESTGTAGAV